MISIVTTAQNKIDTAIKNLKENYSQEKVLLLLDKESYVNGDDILFKSYVFEGYQLSQISTTLFVELYDSEKVLIDKKIILLKNGEGDGSFSLSDDLSENIYYMRAYTAWMANFSEEFQLIKPILVYNSDSDKMLEPISKNNWTAKVFPESGTFIQGIKTKFAVRLYQSGMPINNISGYIIDKVNPKKKLISFKAIDKNVAKFELIAEKGISYQSIIEDGMGNKQTIDLPLATESGISFKVDSNDDAISYEIKAAKLPQNLKNYRIVGTINNHVAYDAVIKDPVESISSKIPVDINENLNGVLQLTVFDDNNLVVAQRLSFIKPNNLEINKPTVSAASLNNSPRFNNELKILENGDFQNYAVLIKNDISSDKILDEENFLSALWLTTDFPEKIVSPARYFDSEKNSQSLDLLLISEKWNRFKWEELLSGIKPIIKYQPLENLSFKGRLAINSAAVRNTNLNLLMNTVGEKTVVFPVKTDDNGFIYLNNIKTQDPLIITYSLNTDKNNINSVPTNMTLDFKPVVNFIPYKGNLPFSFLKYKLGSKNADQRLSAKIELANENKNNIAKIKQNEIVIDEVLLEAKNFDALKKLNNDLTNGVFRSMQFRIIDFVCVDQNTAPYTNIYEWLKERIPGITFQLNKLNYNVPFYRGAELNIYLDENITDIDVITVVPIDNIAMLKIMTGNSLVGNSLAIYTKKGRYFKKTNNEQINNTSIIKGYDKSLVFSQPNFSSGLYKYINRDTREVLYWNPSVSAENNNSKTIKFVNNDVSKNYKITVIGVNENGKLLYLNESF